jgi:hypothetical protein
LTYLRLAKLEVGLLFNFNRPTLKDGLKRFVLSQPRAEMPSGIVIPGVGVNVREHESDG